MQILVTVLRYGQPGVIMADHITDRVSDDKLVCWNAVVDSFTLVI